MLLIGQGCSTQVPNRSQTRATPSASSLPGMSLYPSPTGVQSLQACTKTLRHQRFASRHRAHNHFLHPYIVQGRCFGNPRLYRGKHTTQDRLDPVNYSRAAPDGVCKVGRCTGADPLPGMLPEIDLPNNIGPSRPCLMVGSAVFFRRRHQEAVCPWAMSLRLYVLSTSASTAAAAFTAMMARSPALKASGKPSGGPLPTNCCTLMVKESTLKRL